LAKRLVKRRRDHQKNCTVTQKKVDPRWVEVHFSSKAAIGPPMNPSLGARSPFEPRMNMKATIITTVMGLCLAVPGYAQSDKKPPQKGKPSATERSKAAAQKKAAAKKRALQKRAAQKAGAAKKEAAKKAAAAAKKQATKKSGRPAAGKGPRRGGNKPPAGRPAAGGKGRPDGPPPGLAMALMKLYGPNAKPDQGVPIEKVFGVITIKKLNP
jgi:hypothetical protein